MSWNEFATDVRRALDPDHFIINIVNDAARAAGVKFNASVHHDFLDAMKACAFDQAFCGGLLGTDDNLCKQYKKVCRSTGMSKSEANRFGEALKGTIGIVFDNM